MSAPRSRQPLVKGERLVRYEVSAAMLNDGGETTSMRFRGRRWSCRAAAIGSAQPAKVEDRLNSATDAQASLHDCAPRKISLTFVFGHMDQNIICQNDKNRYYT